MKLVQSGIDNFNITYSTDVGELERELSKLDSLYEIANSGDDVRIIREEDYQSMLSLLPPNSGYPKKPFPYANKIRAVLGNEKKLREISHKYSLFSRNKFDSIWHQVIDKICIVLGDRNTDNTMKALAQIEAKGRVTKEDYLCQLCSDPTLLCKDIELKIIQGEYNSEDFAKDLLVHLDSIISK